MSTAIHCDEPGCDTWAKDEMREGWVTVLDSLGGDHLHFCCPWHLAQWAAQFSPPEVIA